MKTGHMVEPILPCSEGQNHVWYPPGDAYALSGSDEVHVEYRCERCDARACETLHRKPPTSGGLPECPYHQQHAWYPTGLTDIPEGTNDVRVEHECEHCAVRSEVFLRTRFPSHGKCHLA